MNLEVSRGQTVSFAGRLKFIMEPELLHQQSQSYLHHSKACTEQLHHVWGDLEVTREDQNKELRDITNNAQKVWSEAVQFAQDKRSGLQGKISDSLNEIDRIKEQLGEHDGLDSSVSFWSAEFHSINHTCQSRPGLQQLSDIKVQEVTGNAGGSVRQQTFCFIDEPLSKCTNQGRPVAPQKISAFARLQWFAGLDLLHIMPPM